MQHLAEGHPATGALCPPLQERAGLRQPFMVDVHPLAAHPHQGLLGLDQVVELLLGQRVLTDGELPVEVDQAVLSDPGR